MKVLLLGGTGAIGSSIIKYIDCVDNDIYITSRKRRNDSNNIHYIMGDAHNNTFLDQVLQTRYDIIVDLMIYSTTELENRINKLLESTDHYFFMSSARVYANRLGRIDENSSLIIDVSTDQSFLNTDDYALAKAKEERIICSSKTANWTIIRPYITYNFNRFQLGVLEKEDWLFRAIDGRKIVFMQDMADKYTSMTYGDDVGMCIAELMRKDKSKGEIYNIANQESVKWKDVLEIYKSVMERKLDRNIEILMLKDSSEFKKIFDRPFQITYDRLYDRQFNSDKIINETGIQFTTVQNGLTKCMDYFLSNPKFEYINGKYEGWFDKKSKQITPVWRIPGKRNKIFYLKERFL